MFDCHIHSSFSGDSDMPAETACDKAISLGLEGIAFTDHLDYDYPDYDDIFNIDFNEYSNIIDKLKQKYDGRLKVFKGIEVGIQPHVIDETRKVVLEHKFDFVIGSIHIIDKMDPYAGGYFNGKTQKQAYQRYLEEILFMLNNYNEFDVVGHIGYIRRYGSYDDRSLRYADYSDIIDSILNKAISMGKGIEINTSGYKSLNSPIPDFDIVKRYKELGGEIICIGSDAHAPENIGLQFEFVASKLLELGFQYLTHFVERKPVLDKIKS